VIDVQNEYFTGNLPIAYPAGSFTNILAAMDEADAQSIPMAVVRHTAPDEASPVFRLRSQGWELHPLVYSRHRDILIEKQLPGSFTNTDLEGWLRRNDLDTITIAGYMTQMCCDTTAREAVHRGFSVEFLSDATGTLAFSNKAGAATAEEIHRATLVTMASRFAEVLTTEEWIDRVRYEDQMS
jgi:nicotinamidase-related amidase